MLIGLPAIRLSGLYLALITLMAAGAVNVVLVAINFPNGGGGFTGRTDTPDLAGLQPVARPGIAEGDTAYYRYVVVVAAVMFLVALVHVRGKPGRAWAAIRESEPAALAAGVNIVLYKLWAFALASFMAGVAGALLAAQVGQPTRAVVPDAGLAHAARDDARSAGSTASGARSLRDASASSCRSSSRVQWGINPNFVLDPLRRGPAPGAAHGAGRARAAVPEGHGEPRPAALARCRQGDGRRRRRDMIEVEGLTVRFSGVTPIDGMSVTFPGGTCGLIGPNGAGKTTFFNVLSGFVKPGRRARSAAFGEDLLRMADYKRARWGLRRTFQTEQAIEQLSVFDNVAMIYEHSGVEGRRRAGRGPGRDRVRRAGRLAPWRGSAGSAPASAGSWRWRAPSSASRASSYSTSRRQGSRRRRRST